MAQDIFVTSVVKYDSDSGNYFIRLRGSAMDTETGVPARLLNPIPTEDGGGVKSAPVIPRDSQCLVLKDGYRYYILGFLQPKGIVAGGASKPSLPIGTGETFLTHSTRSKVGIITNGSIVLLAQRWAQAVINPISKQFTAFFKNIRLNLWSAIVEYMYDSDANGGTFTIAATKYPQTPINDPAGKNTSDTPDRFVLKAGRLDDEHIIELEITQKFDGPGETNAHKSLTKIGTHKREGSANYFSHDSSRGKVGAETKLLLEATDDSKLHMKFKKESVNKNIDVIYDVAGDTALTMQVNDASKSGKGAMIIILHDGTVKIQTSDNAKINLGGQGFEQPIVTKTWVDNFFAHHMHTNGNQGTPTGPPIAITPDPRADSAAGPYTFTTLAE